MSGSDHGDEENGFLARWSQRKQAAKQHAHEASIAEADAAPEQVAESEPEFDISSLPKLEDITSTTDMTAFLRNNVPERLRNEALRKSWALDPVIRDYVSPALEYAYDWNTPGGVPGSSAIGAGLDVARMVSQIMGGGETATDPSIPAAAAPAKVPPSGPQAPEHDEKPAPDLPIQPLRLGEDAASIAQDPPGAEDGGIIEAEAARSSGADNAGAPQQKVRRHGTARPII
ncbi:DUF3306 domain-containing protein [Bradyrhizobium sp.]|uniref:DUF3306 domain-containing protein n=1 Tax=Bradyrhizobium sp. TaxID=376 RepID=UPI003C71914E